MVIFVVSDIKARPFENYRYRRENTHSTPSTLGTSNLAILIKALSQLKTRWTAGTFVFIDGQTNHPLIILLPFLSLLIIGRPTALTVNIQALQAG